MMLAPVATSPSTSLGWLSPYAPKTIPKDDHIDLDPHNNTVRIAISAAQVDAYSPIEDRMYVNDKDNLFAIFDGHGGGILELNVCYLFTSIYYSEEERKWWSLLLQ
jgi:hypothetical protein